MRPHPPRPLILLLAVLALVGVGGFERVSREVDTGASAGGQATGAPAATLRAPGPDAVLAPGARPAGTPTRAHGGLDGLPVEATTVRSGLSVTAHTWVSPSLAHDGRSTDNRGPPVRTGT